MVISSKEFPDAIQTVDLVLGLAGLVRKIAEVRSKNIPLKLTPKQMELSGILVRNPDGIPIKQAAKLLNISSSAVIQLIDSYGKYKHVSRRTSHMDRRVSLVYMTDRGREYMAENIVTSTKAYRREIFSALSDEEFENLCHYIKQIMAHIEPAQTESSAKILEGLYETTSS